MKKLTLLVAALTIVGATYACDGHGKKSCCKKGGAKKECCKDKKHAEKEEKKA
jgi:hypothetical protein